MKYETLIAAHKDIKEIALAFGYGQSYFSEKATALSVLINTMRSEYLHSISLQVEACILKAKPMFTVAKERRDFEINVHAHGDIYADKNLRMLFCKKVASEISDVDGVPHSFFAERRDLSPGLTEFVIGLNLSKPY